MRFFFFFLVTLFVISFQADETDAMNIQCEFMTGDYGYGSKNGCNVQSVTLSSPEDRKITSLNGDHEKTYDDVGWIFSPFKTFNNFPQNIKKFFPNVEVVLMHTANIATLTKSDMASVGSQLRKFYFYNNPIEALEEGLFDENPNLEYIYLDSNQIKFVASGIFDKLPKLKTLYFRYNRCHSDAANNRTQVLTLIKEIEGNCQDPQTTTTTTTEKVKTEQELRIEELTAENAELKRQQLAGKKQHKEELQKHTAEASLKNENIKQLEKEIEILKKELAAVKPCDELHEVRDSLMSKFKELKKEFDTTKDMIKKTLVKPMNSLHAKLDTMDLKLDTADGKLVSINDTCLSIDYKLNTFKCIKKP